MCCTPSSGLHGGVYFGRRRAGRSFRAFGLGWQYALQVALYLVLEFGVVYAGEFG